MREELTRTGQFDEFVQLLTQLPSETWWAAVKEEPEWNRMLPFSEAWEFGHFAALFVVLGLNDFQTKGKSDVGYWPKVVRLINPKSDPKDPLHLIGILEPFYSKERIAQTKVKRLNRFVRSDLCREIWASSSSSLAAEFGRIWQRLGRTMNQQCNKKTIAYAMKCLALALYMVGETSFDYGAIPVPVDSRIRNVSERLGLPEASETTEHGRWRKALEQIQESHPEITMVHLDSFLWQIGGTSTSEEMEKHLRKLGAGNLASRISGLLQAVSIPKSRGC